MNFTPMVVPSTTICEPCKRPYTHGDEKPSWAIHGCQKPSKPQKRLSPQLPQEERPKGRKWDAHIRENDEGYSCNRPECEDYTHIFPKRQAAQQHAKKHFPPEYKCSECRGEWYLKTEYNQHFKKPCPHCGRRFKQGSLPGHVKNCK